MSFWFILLFLMFKAFNKIITINYLILKFYILYTIFNKVKNIIFYKVKK